MNKLLLLLLLAPFLMMLYSLQADEELATHQLFVLKHAVDRAAHAASQQLDPSALSRGVFRIDEARAEAEALRYLQGNLRLDAGNHPLPGEFLQDRVEILVFRVVNGDSAVFPYTYRNDAYDYTVTLEHPGVILIIRGMYPRTYSVVDPIEWEVKGASELNISS